ncbi:MAG: hypothetical protein ACTSWP_01635 [Candidatus Freyarchaeota archaeon]|nr:hypothetical protein [Candidatus Freyrarchaeum guaymaensis]
MGFLQSAYDRLPLTFCVGTTGTCAPPPTLKLDESAHAASERLSTVRAGETVRHPSQGRL